MSGLIAAIVGGLFMSRVTGSYVTISGPAAGLIVVNLGAVESLGQGDMLFLAPGSSVLTRAQSTYIGDKEIRKLVKYLRKEKPPEFNTEIAGYLDGTAGGSGDGEPGVQDELFNDAVRIVLESQRGSTSLLQRRLGIGYTRASRLMDLMTEAGIVGAFKGSKAREVFMSLEDWDESQKALGEG